jgi:hypothetical protein
VSTRASCEKEDADCVAERAHACARGGVHAAQAVVVRAAAWPAAAGEPRERSSTARALDKLPARTAATDSTRRRRWPCTVDRV